MNGKNIAMWIGSLALVLVFIYSLFFTTPSYNVTFNTDGGTKVQEVKVKKHKTVTKPADPVKEGYKFIEWQVEDTAYNFEIPITNDITITAKWEKIEQKTETKKTTKKATKKSSKKTN